MLLRDFSWRSKSEFDHDIRTSVAFIEGAETFIRRHAAVHGYCDYCASVGELQVDVGPNFGLGYPNLREGMRCICGAKNRDRLMLLAIRSYVAGGERVVLFGSQDRLAAWIREHCAQAVLCEYFGANSLPGETRETASGQIFNQDLCNMTFADRSVDVLIHCDVLEHVPQVEAAARESYRVLKPGGRTIFTMPFFQNCESTVVRAVQAADGTVTHLLPPELHGDPLQPEGIIAYYNFGWDVLDHFTAAGFSRPRVHMMYDVFRGLISNGCPDPSMNMLPIYCEAIKD
jgi:hypothetical protein